MLRPHACVLSGPRFSAGVAAAASYVPDACFASATKQFSDFETMLADVAPAPMSCWSARNTTTSIRTGSSEDLLEGLAARRGDVVLSLEMFERDVQEPLGHFLMGHISEDEFLRSARPWPNYARDYHPLVEFRGGQEWDIVAADVPRTIAAEVAASGLDVLRTKSAADKSAVRERRSSVRRTGRYFKRFAEAMGGHAGTGAGGDQADRATIARFYDAQCLKDETMGESIAQAYFAGSIGGKRPLVVHINGAFHSDYGDGTVERVRRRLPGKRVVLLTILPTDSLDHLAPDSDTPQAR